MSNLELSEFDNKSISDFYKQLSTNDVLSYNISNVDDLGLKKYY